MGIRSKERSEHAWLLLVGRSLYGCLPFDHHSWRCLFEHVDKGFHPRKPVRAVSAGLWQQAIGIRHPLGCWQWELSGFELGEHAGLCLPVFAHTEEHEAQSLTLKGFDPMATQTIEKLEVGLYVEIDRLLRVVRSKCFEFMGAIVIGEIPKTAAFEITDGTAYR